MLVKNKIIRDTIFLTFIQLLLDSSALLLNIFITHRLGTSAIGILSLTGSFMLLIGMVSNGNAFLCISRLVSEEYGKKNGNPSRILLYGIIMCAFLSIMCGIIIYIFSEKISMGFFKNNAMCKPIRLLALALPIGAFSACFKGFFNAGRTVKITAFADIIEFAVKAAVICISTLAIKVPTDAAVCNIMVSGIIVGNLTSLITLFILFLKKHKFHKGSPSISIKKYISLAVPIMAGGCLTSFLSSANDALIPITLRQFGSSVKESLSQFGVFEAIVIPTLFFPSVVMCSLSGIVISETARASANNLVNRIKSIAENLIEKTLIFSILTSFVLMRFGNEIGRLLDGGQLAGNMITIIAPVVPFIYLEIILEAMIKGMGMQAFSSLNYLAEYIIRISIVLIFVPIMGFYGIVLSYYASNIIGNSSRLIKIFRTVKPDLKFRRAFLFPLIYAFLTMQGTEFMFRLFKINCCNIAALSVYIIIWSMLYIIMTSGCNLIKPKPLANN